MASDEDPSSLRISPSERRSRGSSSALRRLSFVSHPSSESQQGRPTPSPLGRTASLATTSNHLDVRAALATAKFSSLDSLNSDLRWAAHSSCDAELDSALDACEKKIRGGSSVLGLLDAKDQSNSIRVRRSGSRVATAMHALHADRTEASSDASRNMIEAHSLADFTPSSSHSGARQNSRVNAPSMSEGLSTCQSL